MSTLWLKILACVAMLCDHIGFFSLLGYKALGVPLRAFGRIAFPIYCYLIAFGYRKTRNKYLYLIRLLAIGLLSELPFKYCFYGTLPFPTFTNVYFTLALGLSAIILFDLMFKAGKWLVYISPLPVAAAAIAAKLLDTDYGCYGVLLIFCFYVAGESKALIAVFCSLFAARNIIAAAITSVFDSIVYSYSFAFPTLPEWSLMQSFAALAIIPILLCNGKRGYTPKSTVSRKAIQYGFYLFYPVHLLIIGLIIRKLIMH